MLLMERRRTSCSTQTPYRCIGDWTCAALPATVEMIEMSRPGDIVFLFDVDNTLLHDDAVRDDLHDYPGAQFGVEARDRYWLLYESLRTELGYADDLGAQQRYRVRCYPAHNYVLADDELRILEAMKHRLSDRLTSVFPRDGE